LEGLKAARTFRNKSAKVHVTLCSSAPQAFPAAKAGVTYISLFVGRLDNIEQNGISLISDIAQIYDNYGFATEILVASVRHPMHIVESALMGVRVETIPFKVIRQLVQHPLTDKGLDSFVSD